MTQQQDDLKCGICFAETHGYTLSEIIESATEQEHWQQVHEKHLSEGKAR